MFFCLFACFNSFWFQSAFQGWNHTYPLQKVWNFPQVSHIFHVVHIFIFNWLFFFHSDSYIFTFSAYSFILHMIFFHGFTLHNVSLMIFTCYIFTGSGCVNIFMWFIFHMIYWFCMWLIYFHSLTCLFVFSPLILTFIFMYFFTLRNMRLFFFSHAQILFPLSHTCLHEFSWSHEIFSKCKIGIFSKCDHMILTITWKTYNHMKCMWCFKKKFILQTSNCSIYLGQKKKKLIGMWYRNQDHHFISRVSPQPWISHVDAKGLLIHCQNCCNVNSGHTRTAHCLR